MMARLLKAGPLALLSLVAAAVVAPIPLAAQSAQRSSIEGVVTDQQAAVIVGATVRLSGDRLLGGGRSVATDEAGRYRFSGLLPGTYAVAATASGFVDGRRDDIDLPVETTYTVTLSLGVAGVATRVEVPARPALIDVRTSGTPVLFDNEVLHDVPTGRTLQSVLGLAPGVTTTTPLFGYVGQVAYGGIQGNNGFSVDGVNLTESWMGAQWSQINYNWLEQVQVVALGAPAEYGTFTGAIANGVLRSGSNRVTGMGEWLTTRPSWTGDNLGDYPDDIDKPIEAREILQWWDLNGQAGLPIVRDRLWLFAGASQLRHEFRPYGVTPPGSRDEKSGRFITKVDAAATKRLMLQGFIARDAFDIVGGGLAPNSDPTSSSDRFTRRWTWNGRGTTTFSANTVAEVRTSGNAGTETQEPHPPATRQGPLPQQDWATGVACCNSYWSDDERSAVTVAGYVAHHRNGSAGRHDLRAGAEFEHAPFDWQRGVPGGRTLFTMNGELVAYEDWSGDHMRFSADRAVAYLQDRWELNDRVTLEPGVRYEYNRGVVPGLAYDFTTNALAARLGVAWDVSGKQSMVVRGHYGRYHDPLLGTVYSYTQPNANGQHIYYSVSNGQAEELFRYVEQVNLPGPPSLGQSYVDQFVAGIERALGAHTTVQAQYIGRRFANYIAWIDLRIDEWTSYEARDPGIDGVPGTPDDGGLFTVYQPYALGPDVSGRALQLDNPDGASRLYHAVQLMASRRFASGWQYDVSYTWSRSTGTVGNQYNTHSVFFDTNPGGVGANPAKRNAPPQRPLYDYSEFKALGSYRIPVWGGVTVGGVFRWHNGTNWQRVARVQSPIPTQFAVEPLGARRTPSLGGLDLRVEKTFRVQQYGAVGLYVDMFNLTNVGRATGYDALSGPGFGQVAGWTDPRTMQLGLRYSF